MKQLINLTFGLIILSFLSLTLPSLSFARSDDNVTVCHKGATTTFNKSALSAHIAHGDTIGPCRTNVPEFGLIPGIIAIASTGGAFIAYKLRNKQ